MPDELIIKHCSPTLAGLKSGAGFKRQFDLASYKEFFEKAEYKDVQYDVVQGTMPCAIAIIQKH